VELEERVMRKRSKPGVVKSAPRPAFQDDGKRHEMIARKAYELYERRGCEPGHEFEDWLEAERQIAAGVRPNMKPQSAP
jgi:hypothetical protein